MILENREDFTGTASASIAGGMTASIAGGMTASIAGGTDVMTATLFEEDSIFEVGVN